MTQVIKESRETLVIQETLVLVVAKAKLAHKDQKDIKELEDHKVYMTSHLPLMYTKKKQV